VRARPIRSRDVAPCEAAADPGQVRTQRALARNRPLEPRHHPRQRRRNPAVHERRLVEKAQRYHVDAGLALAVGGGKQGVDAHAARILVLGPHRANGPGPVALREHVLDVGRGQALGQGLLAPIVIGDARAVGQHEHPAGPGVLGGARIQALQAFQGCRGLLGRRRAPRERDQRGKMDRPGSHV